MKLTIISAVALCAALSAPALALVAEPHSLFNAPTGGVYDPGIQAPTPGIDGAVTGRSEVNAQASGCYHNRQRNQLRICELARRAQNSGDYGLYGWSR